MKNRIIYSVEIPIPKKIQLALFETITNHCHIEIRSFILSHAGEIKDVEDVYHETFIALLCDRRGQWIKKYKCHQKSYIVAVAKNIWLKEAVYRSRFSNELAECHTEVSIDCVDNDSQWREKQFNLFKKHFVWMNHESRRIISFSLKQIPTKEAAAMLGYSEVAYRKRKERYMAQLIARIKDDPQFQILSKSIE